MTATLTWISDALLLCSAIYSFLTLAHARILSIWAGWQMEKLPKDQVDLLRQPHDPDADWAAVDPATAHVKDLLDKSHGLMQFSALLPTPALCFVGIGLLIKTGLLVAAVL